MTASPHRPAEPSPSSSHAPLPSPITPPGAGPERRRTLAAALTAETLRAGRLALSLRAVLEHLPPFDRYRNEGSRILFWASDSYTAVNADAWSCLEHFESPSSSTLATFAPAPALRSRRAPGLQPVAGPLLRQLRLSRGLSLRAASRLAGVDRQSWRSWEESPTTRLRRRSLEKLAWRLPASDPCLVHPVRPPVSPSASRPPLDASAAGHIPR